MRHRGLTHSYGNPPSVTGVDDTPPWRPPKDSLHGPRSRSTSRERLGFSFVPSEIFTYRKIGFTSGLSFLCFTIRMIDTAYLSERDRHYRHPHRSHRENANLYREGGNSKTTDQEVVDTFRKPADGSFAAETVQPSSVGSADCQYRSRGRRRSRRRGGHSDNEGMTDGDDLRNYR